MTASGTHVLTQRQIRRIQTLPEGHTVISTKGRAPIVRRPDGQLARIGPSGRLVATISIERVQSYLHVSG